MLACVPHNPFSVIYKQQSSKFLLNRMMSLKLPPIPAEYLETTFLEESTDTNEYTKLQNERILPFAASEVINASLISAKSITQGADVKKVTEICMNIEKNDLTYQPGYTVGIIPQNCDLEVFRLIDRLQYNEIADKLFMVSIKKTDSKKKFKIPLHIPVIGTIRETLLHNLDIRSIPKKTFLRALTKYTTNEDEINKLNELCSQEGSEKYMQFVTLEYVPLIELLEIFPSCNPPFSTLLEHLPRLLPRPYSITCSPLCFDPPNSQIHFIYSDTPLPKCYEGICTGWLNKLKDSFSHNTNIKITIPVYLRKPNNFILPDDRETNIIMVATGTGIAPFLSFLRHINLESNEKKGSNWLFYGCRYQNRDFLYKNEIESFVNSGIISNLYTSFSRESINNIKYVQDNILLHAQDFIQMLAKNTILYVCGGKNMSKSVHETVIKCVQDFIKLPKDEAETFVNELKRKNKYVEDIWD